MNGIDERFEVKWRQSSRGSFYCDAAVVSADSISRVLELSREVMNDIKALLKDVNAINKQ